MMARLLRIALIVLVIVAAGLGGRGAQSWGGAAGIAVFAAILLVVPAIVPVAAYGLTFFGPGGEQSPVRADQRFARRLAAAMAEILDFWLLFSVFQPFCALWMGDEERLTPAPDAAPVLLIPGFCCNRALWRSLRRELRRAGRSVATLTLDPPFASIDRLAEVLERRIDRALAETGARQVVLVGHSMGGLVARAYLRRRGGERVAALVTIATPHYGTWRARLALGRNAREMEPGSDWLAELNANSNAVPTHCIWSAGDEIVRPPNSAQLPNARATALSLPGHFTLLREPEVLRAVLQAGVARTDARLTGEVHA